MECGTVWWLLLVNGLTESADLTRSRAILAPKDLIPRARSRGDVCFARRSGSLTAAIVASGPSLIINHHACAYPSARYGRSCSQALQLCSTFWAAHIPSRRPRVSCLTPGCKLLLPQAKAESGLNGGDAPQPAANQTLGP
jgi:hypothetical protein